MVRNGPGRMALPGASTSTYRVIAPSVLTWQPGRCVSGARSVHGVGESRVRPATASRRRHRIHGWDGNSFDTVLTGWQAADMTYGIESPFTR